MSAIAGIVHTRKQPLNADLSSILIESYSDYTFDDVQVWQNESASVFVSCHHHWITPESVGEQLPYYDASSQLVITADAIIDNRNELFNQLHVSKRKRREMSDAQMILLAYEKWGNKIVHHLIGDYAFVIIDLKHNKLFGCRDFSGTRSLYYCQDESHSHFAFATTIKPLRQLRFTNNQLNEEWLAEFLAIPTTVEAVDMNTTVYESIRQLPPSHYMIVQDGNVEIVHYDVGLTTEMNQKLSNSEYEEAFCHLFNKVIKERTRSSGKVGAHLSGGLDSGLVTSFAAKALHEQQKILNTYSYVPDASFTDWTPTYYTANETEYIQSTIDHVGNIRSQVMDFEGNNAYSEIDHFLKIMEMPYKFFENTFWLKRIYEKAQIDGVKVLLSGARGNHSISWGSIPLTYDYYCSLLLKMRWFKLFSELDAYCANYHTGKSHMLPLIAKRAISTITSRVFSFQQNQDKGETVPFIHPQLAAKTNVYDKLARYGITKTGVCLKNLNDYRKHHYESVFSWNKSGVAGTNLSLRYQLWDRDPTNDLRIVRFCLSIPTDQYVTEGMERSFIRRVAKNYLSDKVRLNLHTRGIQGADTIHRMSPQWHSFITECTKMSNDYDVSTIFNMDVIKQAITHLNDGPRSDNAFNDYFRVLCKSLIVYRFLKKNF